MKLKFSKVQKIGRNLIGVGSYKEVGASDFQARIFSSFLLLFHLSTAFMNDIRAFLLIQSPRFEPILMNF